MKRMKIARARGGSRITFLTKTTVVPSYFSFRRAIKKFNGIFPQSVSTRQEKRYADEKKETQPKYYCDSTRDTVAENNRDLFFFSPSFMQVPLYRRVQNPNP